jgi:LacI family transcriptional regulator
MGIDLVFFDRGFSDAGYSYVKVADRESARNGVEYLIAKGYKKIAHIAGYETSNIGRERKAGYFDALKNAGIHMPESAITEGGFSEEDGVQGFKKLIENYGIPEAIFSVTYPVGLGMLKQMRDMGIDESEIKSLAFGGSDLNKYLSTPLICIDQPNFELGKRAFEQLLKETQSTNKTIPKTVVMSAGIL